MDLTKFFDDTGLQILAVLQASHLREMESLRREIDTLKMQLVREKGTVSDVLSICECDIRVCDHCRCLLCDEVFSCETCAYCLCASCNQTDLAIGYRDDDDEEEYCLWCELHCED